MAKPPKVPAPRNIGRCPDCGHPYSSGTDRRIHKITTGHDKAGPR